jgi:PDZ domain-containing protein
MGKQKKVLFLFLLIFLVIALFPMPYYVSTPGMAKELSAIIEVDGGHNEEAGSFMLTTIRIGKANIVQLAWAKISEYRHIFSEEDLRPNGESDEEYHERQLHMMDSSKDSAAFVAYKFAGKKAEIKANGVYVLNVLKGMPAEKAIHPGDRIFKVDNLSVETAETLIEYVSNKQEGDVVEIVLERKGEELSVPIPLKSFPGNEEQVGVGIQLVTDRNVLVEPEVLIKTDEIGGPSAGLMFSLEIYNQLIEGDLTKGYNIAGTGTVNYEGKVGPIGGIKQKVVAADRAGADFFLAPNENGRPESNYELALEAATDIGTSMTIVAINTFEEAVEFLNGL